MKAVRRASEWMKAVRRASERTKAARCLCYGAHGRRAHDDRDDGDDEV